MPRSSPPVVPNELIEQKIYLIRGHKVMLDSDLAELYDVTTGNLNLAVRRNPKRFPEGFMFQLSRKETQSLLLQNARAKGRGGRRTPPLAFTEQGVSMALERSQQRTGYRSEHCHHEGVRAPPGDARHSRRLGSTPQ